MINETTNSNKQRKYDLEDRTLKFSKEAVIFAKNVEASLINNPLISQFIRSATSIGANYHEANESISKKDFCNKISISKKEAKETMYWLKVIRHASPEVSKEAYRLLKEAQELVLIFSAIIKKSNTGN